MISPYFSSPWAKVYELKTYRWLLILVPLWLTFSPFQASESSFLNEEKIAKWSKKRAKTSFCLSLHHGVVLSQENIAFCTDEFGVEVFNMESFEKRYAPCHDKPFIHHFTFNDQGNLYAFFISDKEQKGVICGKILDNKPHKICFFPYPNEVKALRFTPKGELMLCYIASKKTQTVGLALYDFKKKHISKDFSCVIEQGNQVKIHDLSSNGVVLLTLKENIYLWKALAEEVPKLWKYLTIAWHSRLALSYDGKYMVIQERYIQGDCISSCSIYRTNQKGMNLLRSFSDESYILYIFTYGWKGAFLLLLADKEQASCLSNSYKCTLAMFHVEACCEVAPRVTLHIPFSSFRLNGLINLAVWRLSFYMINGVQYKNHFVLLTPENDAIRGVYNEKHKAFNQLVAYIHAAIPSHMAAEWHEHLSKSIAEYIYTDFFEAPKTLSSTYSMIITISSKKKQDPQVIRWGMEQKEATPPNIWIVEETPEDYFDVSYATIQYLKTQEDLNGHFRVEKGVELTKNKMIFFTEKYGAKAFDFTFKPLVGKEYTNKNMYHLVFNKKGNSMAYHFSVEGKEQILLARSIEDKEKILSTIPFSYTIIGLRFYEKSDILMIGYFDHTKNQIGRALYLPKSKQIKEQAYCFHQKGERVQMHDISHKGKIVFTWENIIFLWDSIKKTEPVRFKGISPNWNLRLRFSDDSNYLVVNQYCFWRKASPILAIYHVDAVNVKKNLFNPSKPLHNIAYIFPNGHEDHFLFLRSYNNCSLSLGLFDVKKQKEVAIEYRFFTFNDFRFGHDHACLYDGAQYKQDFILLSRQKAMRGVYEKKRTVAPHASLLYSICFKEGGLFTLNRAQTEEKEITWGLSTKLDSFSCKLPQYHSNILIHFYSIKNDEELKHLLSHRDHAFFLKPLYSYFYSAKLIFDDVVSCFTENDQNHPFFYIGKAGNRSSEGGPVFIPPDIRLIKVTPSSLYWYFSLEDLIAKYDLGLQLNAFFPTKKVNKTLLKERISLRINTLTEEEHAIYGAMFAALHPQMKKLKLTFKKHYPATYTLEHLASFFSSKTNQKILPKYFCFYIALSAKNSARHLDQREDAVTINNRHFIRVYQSSTLWRTPLGEWSNTFALKQPIQLFFKILYWPDMYRNHVLNE